MPAEHSAIFRKPKFILQVLEKVITMVSENQKLRVLIWAEWKKKIKTGQAVKNINAVFGKDLAKSRTVQYWYRCFITTVMRAVKTRVDLGGRLRLMSTKLVR